MRSRNARTAVTKLFVTNFNRQFGFADGGGECGLGQFVCGCYSVGWLTVCVLVERGGNAGEVATPSPVSISSNNYNI